MNTKQLRQKILDLAIRGKLVPQDPNDEPASVFLEKIRIEKERLIKEKKIKRSKNELTVSTGAKSHYQNVPFEIPENWVWVKLEDIVFLKAGFFVKANDISKEYDINLFPCYGGNGLRGYVQDYTHEGLYALIGRQGALCGNINLAKGKFHATEHAIVVTPYGEINTLWMFYFLKALNLNQYSIGAAQPGLSVERINKILCPLPCLPEQQRIVSVIETAFSLVDQIEENKLSLEQFIKQTKSKVLDIAIRGKLVPQDSADEPASILLERVKSKQKTSKITADKFPYPFEVPLSWIWVSGYDCFRPMKSKKPKGEIFGYIDINSVDNKKHIITKPKYLKVSEAPSRANREVSAGDTLFSMVRPYLENIAYVDNQNADSIASTGFYVCKPTQMLFPKYLYYLMLSSYVIEGLNTFMKGDNSPSINNDNITSFLYPLPPLTEQHRIVIQIEKIFAQLNKIEKALKA